MSLKNLTIGAMAAVFIFATPSVAQKYEVSGIVGRFFISDQGIQGAPSNDPNLHFGKGLSFEGIMLAESWVETSCPSRWRCLS